MGRNVTRFKDQDGNVYDMKDVVVRKELQRKCPVVYESLENQSVVTFPDGANGMPIKKLEVAINPVQDLHGYANPWPGGGGKNLCPPIQNATFQQVTTSTDSMGKTTVTGTATGSGGRLNLCSVPFTLPAGSYIFAHNGTGTWGYTLSLSEDGGSQLYECRSTSTYSTFTLSESKTVVVGITIESGVQYNGTVSPQIEVGSQKTSYAPYSNICPISGHTGCNVSRTGKNLLKVKYPGRKNNEVTYTTNADGTISVSGTATASSYFAQNYGFEPQYMTLLPPGTYTLHSDVSSESIRVYGSLFDVFGNSKGTISHDTGSGTTFTLTDYAWFTFQIYIVNGTVVNTTVKPMLELGSTASSYEPYVGNTYAITFPDAAGTVYGGTLTIHKDGNGKLVIGYGIATENTFTDFSTKSNNHMTGYVQVDDIGSKQNGIGITNMLPVDNAGAWNDDFPVAQISISMAGRLRVYGTFTSLEEFKQQFAGLQFVYELATPVEIDLTELEVIETLKWINNVWSDTGNASIEYPADTLLYISKRIAETQALALE